MYLNIIQVFFIIENNFSYNKKATMRIMQKIKRQNKRAQKQILLILTLVNIILQRNFTNI